IDLPEVKMLTWRRQGEVVMNEPRPFIPDLNELPMPVYDKLPLDKYRMPLMKGPFTFLVTARGCTAGCKYCIKHVSYQWSVRLLTPERIMRALSHLNKLAIHNIHIYADLSTVNREPPAQLSRRTIADGLNIR